jgi:hypothetical protein
VRISAAIHLTSFLLLLATAQAAPVFPEPAGADSAGFAPIFDGKTLTGWDADPKYWRIEHETLVGEVTPETLLKANSFATWRGGAPADFELKIECRNFLLKTLPPAASQP